MTELEFHRLLCFGLLVVAALVFVLLFWITAPYGRHHGGRWGPSIPSRVGWIVMEAPAVVFFIAVYALGEGRLAPVPLVLLALWQLHYLNRTLIYPWRARGQKRMPLTIVGMALCFSFINPYINARHLSHFGDYGVDWFSDPRFGIGAVAMLIGFGINNWADGVLMRLRKPGESGYRIPEGGLYRWVTCPNYLGEIIEWIGWAIATWSLPGLCFAVFTVANLAPRALSNHRWYRRTFADYPSDRRALIPGIW